MTMAMAMWVGSDGALLGAEAAGRFDGEIRAFERRDATNPPAPGVVLFTGSSSVVKWRSLADDFAGYPVLNRGFGGSTWRDLNHYFVRVVPRYQPRAVVVYEGDNDLAAGRSVAECLADFDKFHRLMREHLPGAPVAILAVKPSASRRHLMTAQTQLNRQIQERIRSDENWALLDIASLMVDSAGEPRAELFEPDRLHVNAAGYALWVPLVRPWVEKFGGP